MELFRPQALEAVGNRAAQPIGLGAPASWMITGLFALLCVAVVVFLFLGDYSRRETVRGTVRPAIGLPSVVTARSGVVVSVLAQQGQGVSAGDVLVRFATQETTSEGMELHEARMGHQDAQEKLLIEKLEADEERLAAQVDELGARLREIDKLMQEHTANIGLQSERVALASKIVENIAPMRARMLISEVEFQRHQFNALDAKQALAQANRDLANTRMSRSSALADRIKLVAELRSLRAQSASESARLDQTRLTSDLDAAFALVAPSSGRIGSVMIRPGDFVAAGSPVAIIVPPSAELAVELDVPSSAIGFVRPGDEVKVMFDAFPYQRFGFGSGTVDGVSEAPVTTQIDPASGLETSMYRVRVKLAEGEVDAYGREWPLSPGMSVSADMILEKRSFMRWLLDPLIAASRRNH